MPLHRLGTLKEVSSVDFLNESERGSTGRGSQSRPQSLRHHLSADDNNGLVDEMRIRQVEEEEEEEERPQASQPPAWAAEPRDETPQNPLLRRPQWNEKK